MLLSNSWRATGLAAFLLFTSGLSASGCGGAGPEAASSPVIRGTVVERAEGFSERPGWADEGQPISRKDSALRVSGYVAIEGSSRIEMGYRAADSYARAELVRFIAARIVAVLEDKLSNDDGQVISERITEHAGAWVDQLTIAARYWEKRQDGDTETLHIWSRLDLSPEEMATLTDQVLSQAEGLKAPAGDLRQALNQNWDTLADPRAYSATTQLPKGIFTPDWAKAGDIQTGDSFEFTCHGLSPDEKTARLLAESQCSEKLCKLFGVQITSETTVVEDLNGVTAKSEVKERCPDVRVVGRETRYHTGECGPQGCIYWLGQTYPKSAFEEEKKRLLQPSVIRQQVVIQEGDKLYRDPEQCRQELTAYGAVRGMDAKAFQARSKHLHRAVQVCQDIDGREVGLFNSLDHLLREPLGSFSVSAAGHNSSDRSHFTVTGKGFTQRLDSARFLIERIQLVTTLVDDAILPMEILDLSGASQAQVEAVMKKVVALPLKKDPTSPHHQWNIHSLALVAASGFKVPYSRTLRDFALRELKSMKMDCSENGHFSGNLLINYLGKDGSLDSEEWSAGLGAVARTRDERVIGACLDNLWGEDKAATTARLDELTTLVVSGKIQTGGDALQIFTRAVGRLDGRTQLATYERFKTRFTSSEKSRTAFTKQLLNDGPRYEEGCQDLPSYFQEVRALFPEASVDQSSLCMCLSDKGGLSGDRRKLAAFLMFEGSTATNCGHFKSADWPERYYPGRESRAVPQRGASPFGNYRLTIDSEAHACMTKHNLFNDQIYVTVNATLVGSRITHPKVTAALMAEAKSLDYLEKRPGYAKLVDIERVNQEVGSCVERVLTNAELPPEVPSVKRGGTHRIFWDYWGKNRGTALYLDEASQ